MKIILGLIFLFMAGPSVTARVQSNDPPVPQNTISQSDLASLHELSDRNTGFALNLYASLIQGEKSNVFLSPFSISTALAMTLAGARGETKEQMAKVLYLDPNSELLHSSFAKLIEAIEAGAAKGGYKLSVANALWAQRDVSFLAEFLKLTNKNYRAGLQLVDFVQATEEARVTINRWVEEKTNKKIKDLLAKGVLNDATRLVLTNAIYFKGNWLRQFDKKLTKDAPFFLGKEQSISSRLMGQSGNFSYFEGVDFQMAELPYDGNDLSMVIVLPNEIDGLSKLEEQLTAANLDSWLQLATSEVGTVLLPQFKMTCSFKLAKELQSLGMVDAFSGAADFSGMTEKPELKIQDVIHKAFIEVNEEGTEAAAATAVVIGVTRTSTTPPPKNFMFRADHPFLFLIRHRQTGSILFMGRVMNPAS